MKKSSHDSRRPEGRQFATGAAPLPRAASECRHGPLPGVQPASPPRSALPDPEARRQLSVVFALLGNETRVSLLLALNPSDAADEARELCVCDLAALVGTSPSMTSHQLRLLREHGLVRQRRTGKRMMYSLVQGPLGHLLRDALEHVATAAPSGLQTAAGI